MVSEEKQIHLDAFETFLEYRLNNQTINKSINLVAEKYDYSARTVWIWYKDFDWKNRERTRRAEINEITIKKHNNNTVIKLITFCLTLLNIFFRDKLPFKLKIDLSKATWFFLKLCVSIPSLKAIIGSTFLIFLTEINTINITNTGIDITVNNVADRLNDNSYGIPD